MWPVLAVFAALPAAGTILRPVSFRELIAWSDIVVVGRVEELQAGLPISTLVEISVERVLKGPHTTHVTFCLPGGQSGERLRVYEGCPKLERGDRVFLLGLRAEGGTYRTTGFSAGAFRIVRDPDSGAEFVLPASDIPQLAQRVELALLLEAVEEAVSGREGPALAQIERLMVRPGSDATVQLGQTNIPATEESVRVRSSSLTVVCILAGGTLLVMAVRRRTRAARTAVLVLCACVLAAAGSKSLSAYTRIRSLSTRGPYCWWDVSAGPVSWYMVPDEDAGCDGAFEVVKAAFQTWEDLTLCEISFRYGGPPPEGATRGFADDSYNVVFWDRSSVWDPNVLAVTAWTAHSATGKLLDVDIGFNGSLNWTTGWETPFRQPVWGVIEHEVGHMLGLGHNVEDPTSTMYPYFHPGIRFLSPDDVAGARAIYPDKTPPAPPVVGRLRSPTGTNCAIVLEGSLAPDACRLDAIGPWVSSPHIELEAFRWRCDAVLTPGTHEIFLTASDESGNTSVPVPVCVTVFESGPLVERFALRDLSTGSEIVTNADTVAVELVVRPGPGGCIRRWLITEDRLFEPDAAMLETFGMDSPPRVWSFSERSEGLKTAYLWLSDEAANVTGPIVASIFFDWQAPEVVSAQALDQSHVVVEFSEPVSGELHPSAYVLSGGAQCLGVERIGGHIVLQTTPLVSGATYRLAARPPLADASGANMASTRSWGAEFSVGPGGPAVANIHSQTSQRTVVTYTRDVIGGASRTSYAIGNYVFSPEYNPLKVIHLGGWTYELDYWGLASPAAPDGYETYLLIRSVTDLVGNPLPCNGQGPWYEGRLRTRGYAPPPDWLPPRIELLELVSLDGPDGSSRTSRPKVAVRILESDPDGGVVRWFLSEDPTPPDAVRMWRDGMSRRPCSFDLVARPGTHTVFAWVMDEDGNISASASASIELVSDAPPVAAISPICQTCLEAPAEVAFDASSSYDPEGGPLEYYWDFGDGCTSLEPNPVHTFVDVGEFEVLLVVTDDHGRTATDSVKLTVVDTTPPKIDIVRVVLAGRVDSPYVHEIAIEVDGMAAGRVPVSNGRYEAAVELPAGPCHISLRLFAQEIEGALGQRALEAVKDAP